MKLLSKYLSNKRKRRRFLYRGLSILIGFVALFFMTLLMELNKFYLAAIPGVLALLAAVFEFIVAEVLVERKYPSRTEKIIQAIDEKLEDLSSKLIGVILETIKEFEACNREMINATIHLKVETFVSDGDGKVDSFLQILPYVSLGKKLEEFFLQDKKQWRAIPAHLGIIGRAMRTGRPETVNFSTQEEFHHRMITEFGFTKESATKRTLEARSYYAYPINNKTELIGVLYFFTSEQQVFPKAVDNKKIETSIKHLVDLLQLGRIIE